MLHGLKQLVAGLQKSDEARKRRWIFGATTVTMTLVAFFWLAHLNATVKNVSIGAGAVPKIESRESGFLATMERGGAIVYQNLSAFLKTKINAKKEIDIEQKRINFQASDIPAIEPRDMR